MLLFNRELLNWNDLNDNVVVYKMLKYCISNDCFWLCKHWHHTHLQKINTFIPGLFTNIFSSISHFVLYIYMIWRVKSWGQCSDFMWGGALCINENKSRSLSLSLELHTHIYTFYCFGIKNTMAPSQTSFSNPQIQNQKNIVALYKLKTCDYLHYNFQLVIYK